MNPPKLRPIEITDDQVLNLKPVLRGEQMATILLRGEQARRIRKLARVFR